MIERCFEDCYKHYFYQHDDVLIFCICIARENHPTTMGSKPQNDKIFDPFLTEDKVTDTFMIPK